MAIAELSEVFPYDESAIAPMQTMVSGPGLPYDLEVVSWDILPAERQPKSASIETAVAGLNDGSCFVVRKVIPNEQTVDLFTDMTPPLATRVKGFNTYVALQLAKLGIPSRIVGANQSPGHSLLHDAQATLLALNHDDEFSDTNYGRPGKSVYTGYSMGMMKGFGIVALAPAMGRDIEFSVGLDPCVAKQVKYSEQAYLELVESFGHELLELPKSALHAVHDVGLLDGLARVRHLAGSISLHPKFWSIVCRNYLTLATGEAGELASEMPQDTVAVVHFLEDCAFNDDETFSKILDKYPYITTFREPGYHLRGGDPLVVSALVGQIAMGIEMSEAGVDKQDLAVALATPLF